jgi:excisionase family DNA binding protein
MCVNGPDPRKCRGRLTQQYERNSCSLDDWLDRPTLSVNEVATLLGIGRGAAYSAVRSGELHSLRLGQQILIPTAALSRMRADS